MRKTPPDDKQRLKHILSAIADVEQFTAGVDYETYMQNYLLRLGLTRLVEIIGEASGHLSRGLRSEFNEVEWVAIKGMRNILFTSTLELITKYSEIRLNRTFRF